MSPTGFRFRFNETESSKSLEHSVDRDSLFSIRLFISHSSLLSTILG
jgi:hypothetical protein